MNNLQHIVKDNTRFAMHMAVELCEQGDFDSVTEAFRWLNQEAVGNYTRWHELFGSPERAANVILALQICPMSKDECREFCPAHDVCFEFYKDGRTVYEMAEWLRGVANE